MAETRHGTLLLKGKPKPYSRELWEGRQLAVDDNGVHRKVDKPKDVLDKELRNLPADAVTGVDVEFDWDGTRIRKIRRRSTGEQADDIPPGFELTEAGGVRPIGGSGSNEPLSRRRGTVNEFHNPYTFVPTPDRSVLKHGTGTLGLGDDEPAGHDSYRDGLWSGTIDVVMTAETPILLLDTASPRPIGNQHYVYDPLLRDGRPHLPATAVKGMLRTIYEAATNSRFGVFIGHDAPLGYRPNARANLVPARVSRRGEEVELLTGTSPEKLPVGPTATMHAAWLPRYGSPVKYSDNSCPEHKDAVRMHLQLVQHHRRDGQRYKADFRYWRVLAAAKEGDRLPPLNRIPPGPPPDPNSQTRGTYHQMLPDTRANEPGTVFVTNQNFSSKHDERVFFGSGVPKKVDREIFAAYQVLVADYVAAHRPDELHERKDKDNNGRTVGPERYLGREPGKTAWSRHLYEPGWARLDDGDLCYAELDDAGNVGGLYPVSVSRRLYPTAPADLVPELLSPAATRGCLSPADRVFGWVLNSAGRGKAGGHGAYRGQLRVGPVDGSQARVETFPGPDGCGFPLAILGQPKPQQGRFYAKASTTASGRGRRGGRDDGNPSKTAKDGWYVPTGQLRGRKVYPHHAGLPDGHWQDPLTDRTQQEVSGRYQEYRRPRAPKGKDGLLVDGTAFAVEPGEEQRDIQNRSVTGWVAKGSRFRFTLEVRNLSEVELGALLWVLSLPPGHFHRIGLGKPLGFGSVRLDVELGADGKPSGLRRGESWRAYYADFADELPGDPPDVRELKAAFSSASDVWKRKPHLDAISAAAKGDGAVPVHYPRVRPEGLAPYGMNPDVPVPPDPRGRAYAWFVQNERVRRVAGTEEPIHGVSLPAAGGDPLEVHPEKTKPPRGGTAGRRPR